MAFLVAIPQEAPGGRMQLNGPGNNASFIRDDVAYNLKAGDVVVIPAGTGHRFTKSTITSRI